MTVQKLQKLDTKKLSERLITIALTISMLGAEQEAQVEVIHKAWAQKEIDENARYAQEQKRIEQEHEENERRDLLALSVDVEALMGTWAKELWALIESRIGAQS